MKTWTLYVLTIQRFVKSYELQFSLVRIRNVYWNLYFLFYLQLWCDYYIEIWEQVGSFFFVGLKYKLLIFFFQSWGCECSKTCSMRLNVYSNNNKKYINKKYIQRDRTWTYKINKKIDHFCFWAAHACMYVVDWSSCCWAAHACMFRCGFL